ncbi:MAG: PAS domain-containing protein, partial [Alphaproteobacteria bacterium]|nr:PAS domain-containing protein [Alphaproteobacteria bacterium]
MATQDVSQNLSQDALARDAHPDPRARRQPHALDRTGDRAGSISMVLVVALLLVGSVIAFLFIGRSNAQPYVLILLSALAVVGVFSLFAGAAGIVRLAGRDARDTFHSALAESAPDGLVVTDDKRRVVYANPAYMTLSEAVDADDVRPVERVFVGDPLVSEAIYRLAKASREGRQLQEEVRVPGAQGAAARWLRLRVRPLQPSGPYARWTAWSIADVTRDRDRQENVFQELQQAIDFLDHAPAGFFSVDPDGNISYLNATLSSWLDYDLAQVGSGGLKLADIVAGEGSALLAPVAGEPADVKTEVHDLDLKTRAGRTVPVRLYHKIAFAADGTPGASRTLVLNRAREEVADPA